MPAWIKDTIYRLLVEVVRVWVVGYYLETKRLPEDSLFWVYPGGGYAGIDWGNPQGPDNPELQPLRRKKIEVSFRIVED